MIMSPSNVEVFSFFVFFFPLVEESGLVRYVCGNFGCYEGDVIEVGNKKMIIG